MKKVLETEEIKMICGGVIEKVGRTYYVYDDATGAMIFATDSKKRAANYNDKINNSHYYYHNFNDNESFSNIKKYLQK